MPVFLGMFLQQYCNQKGFEMPRVMVLGGAVSVPLCDLLCKLGVPAWAEIMVGSSHRAHRALDAHMRVLQRLFGDACEALCIQRGIFSRDACESQGLSDVFAGI